MSTQTAKHHQQIQRATHFDTPLHRSHISCILNDSSHLVVLHQASSRWTLVLHTQEVTGSSPVAPTTRHSIARISQLGANSLPSIGRTFALSNQEDKSSDRSVERLTRSTRTSTFTIVTVLVS